MNADSTSLERLHDVIVPPPAPWWPPPPGWQWALGFLTVIAMVVLLRVFLHWQRNRYRREALAELKRIQAGEKNSRLRGELLARLAELLKRGALSAFPRERVASLTGSAWFAFLDRTGRTTAFSRGLGTTLERAAYDPRAAATLDEREFREIIETVRHWIAHHAVELDAPPPAASTRTSQAAC